MEGRERERRKKATNGAHEYTHDTTHGRYKHTRAAAKGGDLFIGMTHVGDDAANSRAQNLRTTLCH